MYPFKLSFMKSLSAIFACILICTFAMTSCTEICRQCTVSYVNPDSGNDTMNIYGTECTSNKRELQDYEDFVTAKADTLNGTWNCVDE